MTRVNSYIVCHRVIRSRYHSQNSSAFYFLKLSKCASDAVSKTKTVKRADHEKAEILFMRQEILVAGKKIGKQLRAPVC